MQRHRKRDTLTAFLYVRALLIEFRGTLLALAIAIAVGAMLYSTAPHTEYASKMDLAWSSLYYAWMALLVQPIPSEVWYLKLISGIYPLVGVVVIGEGIVRLALLIASKEHGEKEWMKVMASTYSNHVVLCGVGHLGFRVLEQLLANQVPVVVLEKNAEARFVAQARAMGVPVLIRNMKEDQALIDAGIERAKVIIIATNDDMANIEVALDSRRMNPKIRILMRQYDQQIAAKISGALEIDAAFSSSALSAPILAAMAMDAKVMASFVIQNVPYVAAEVKVDSASTLNTRTIADIEKNYTLRVVARVLQSGICQSPPPMDAIITSGDVLVVHTAAAKLSALAADSKLKP
jgi:voltage-gated potassium channel